MILQPAIHTIKYHIILKWRLFRQGTSVIQVIATDQDTINEPVTYEIIGCKYQQYQAHILFNLVCPQTFVFSAFFFFRRARK